MDYLLENVIYNSEIMQQVRKDLGPFVDSAASILFWGETKSGMGFYARTLHEASHRQGKFFIIPAFSLDDDSVKQQFLGAGDDPGWLEDAHHGTIFFRRISEASAAVQQILSQILGNQSANGRIQFSRKGRTERLEANVRLLYSMTHDFNIALQDGLLRRDFVAEIKKRGKIVRIPPLRERPEDIVDIAKNFFPDFNQRYHQNISAIDGHAQEILTRYIWPGNIDELKRVIEGIFAHYQGIGTITEEHIPDHIRDPEITGDKYSFKLKDDTRFVGKILSPLLIVQTESKIVSLNTGDLIEIMRVDDTRFAPPKFKHFMFTLKDGSQLTGQIKDPKMIIETSFDPDYDILTPDLYSMILS